MLIKKAEQGDIEAIRELLSECGLHNADIGGKSGHLFLTAWEENTLVGTVALEVAGESALLRSLAVIEQYRRRAIATELVNAIELYAGSNRIRQLYLLTLTAEAFFAGRGYQRTDRGQAPAALQETTEFKSVCPASAVCMTKKL